MAKDPKFLSVFDKKKNDDGVSLKRLAQIVKDRDIEIVDTSSKDKPKEKQIQENRARKLDPNIKTI